MLWCLAILPSEFGLAGAVPNASLFAHDALVSPRQSAVIDAGLTVERRGRQLPAVGTSLELVQDAKVLATAVTDERGMAALRFVPTRRGVQQLVVRTASGSGVTAAAAATVAVWERRMPILTVEVTALRDPASGEPLPDAADELQKVAQFYYNVVYVAAEPGDAGRKLAASDRTRQWLAEHGFPVGYVLVSASAEAFGSKLDELRSAGWMTIKIGVGRSKEFADVFAQRRLDAVLVPEPAKGEAPRKAKVAKTWKDVRRKL
ncbi:MAG: hypothetical protein P0111_17830 [Nitrospira sp.]|nr:hypothetical protein [Nitrospira sp.]